MSCIHVTTQTELDAALALDEPGRCIHVDGDGEFEISSSGSATVRASGSATVRATKYVAVHKHSPRTSISGGVLIEPVKMNDPTAAEWAEYYDLDVVDGIVTVYKGVNDQWTTSHGADYSPGATPEAADWKPTNECGNGLHFSPSPGHTLDYNSYATRFLACPVKLADVIVLGDKVKAPRVEEPGYVEVDLIGRPVVRDKDTAKK